MTTYDKDDDFDEELMTTDETEDDLCFVEEGVCSRQNFGEALSPYAAKGYGDVSLPFLKLALLAAGLRVDQSVEDLLAEALRNLNIEFSLFIDDQVSVQFGVPSSMN